ncbi:hypothetical protein ABFX02_04G050200 [Erythranthe guttata]
MEAKKVTFLFIGLLSMALLVNSSDIGEEKAQVISLGSCDQHPNCRKDCTNLGYDVGTCCFYKGTNMHECCCAKVNG